MSNLIHPDTWHEYKRTAVYTTPIDVPTPAQALIQSQIDNYTRAGVPVVALEVVERNMGPERVWYVRIRPDVTLTGGGKP